MVISKIFHKSNILVRLYSKMSKVEDAKKLAAYRAVDENVQDGMKLGIGSGSTVVYAVERLAERIKKERLDITCVPTSFQAEQLIIQNGLKLSNLNITPNLDLDIDGADECDFNLTLIKGGGGCLLQEKIVAHNSNKVVIIADFNKRSLKLGEKWKKGIPIEVLPTTYIPIKKEIENKFKGECNLRMAVAKAGPCVTDNGNFILDWKFFEPREDWEQINSKILSIPGVVETGLFINMAEKAYFGLANGNVEVKEVTLKKSPCSACA